MYGLELELSGCSKGEGGGWIPYTVTTIHRFDCMHIRTYIPVHPIIVLRKQLGNTVNLITANFDPDTGDK